MNSPYEYDDDDLTGDITLDELLEEDDDMVCFYNGVRVAQLFKSLIYWLCAVQHTVFFSTPPTPDRFQTATCCPSEVVVY